MRACLAAFLALAALPAAAAAADTAANDRFFQPDVQIRLAEHVGLLAGARNACAQPASAADYQRFVAKYILLLNIRSSPEVTAAIGKGANTGLASVKAGKLPCTDVETSVASFDEEIARQWPELEKYQLTRLSWTAGFAAACGAPQEQLSAFMQKVFAVTRLPVDENLPLAKEQIAEGRKAKAEQPDACPAMVSALETVQKTW